jgi:hypothetical protein
VTPLRPALRAALALALFFTIWGAKLVTIDRYGSDLPYWDQWAKEGDYLLTPWAERHELWKNLFLPHNEHRIAPTLALNLVLVAQGGQWDARVQCVASAALHAALAAGLFLWTLRRFPLPWALAAGSRPPPRRRSAHRLGKRPRRLPIPVLLPLRLHPLRPPRPPFRTRALPPLVARRRLRPPCSREHGLRPARRRPARRDRRASSHRQTHPRRDAWITLAAALVIGGLGAYLRTPAPWHDTLHAKTLGAFLIYAARCLSWPLPQHPWLVLVLWLPWLGLFFHRARSALISQHSTLNSLSSAPHSASTDFLLAAGLWVLLQIAAVTYSRAGDGAMPASRYGDIAALGLIVSSLSLVQLAALVPCRHRNLSLFGAIYLGCIAACVVIATRDVVAGPLPDKKKESLASERSVQAFVLTDDYETFAKSPLPFPLPDWLARILRRPDIRAVLPTSVRAPLRIDGFATPAPSPAPPLPHRRAYTHSSATEWRSAPLPAATLAFWKIETTGPAFAATPSPSSAPLLLTPATSIAPSRASPPPANGVQPTCPPPLPLRPCPPPPLPPIAGSRSANRSKCPL